MSYMDLVKQHASYLCCYSQNVKELETCLHQLEAKITVVRTEVEAAERRGHVIKEVVNNWLKDAELILANGRRMVERPEDTQCLRGFCCHCLLQYRPGKEVAGKITEINNSVQGLNEFSGDVSNPPPPQSFEDHFPSDFHASSSRMASKDAVLEAIKDDNIYTIGIYGVGGIGKTRLMKEVRKIVEEEKLFNVVVMVSVSQSKDINKNQKEIAYQIGFQFDNSETQRADRLLHRLKQIKKVLIIVDYLWEKLDLHKVGIPLGYNDHGCKTVITTQSADVCDWMRCNKKMHMEVLSEKDSWELFKMKAGDTAERLQVIAKEVCRECGGLPLAIVTVGSTLRDKDEKMWENVLRKLKKAAASSIKDMEHQVFQSIKLSYACLKNVDAKLGFLFCCIFPADYDIDEEEFTMYVFGEGFLKAHPDTWLEACSEVRGLFDMLKASCLLVKGDKEGTVRMHDVVRCVAIWIAQEDEGFLIKPHAGLTGWSDAQHRSDECKRISLMGNDIQTLGGQPRYAKLRTLILRENRSLGSISDGFFTAMKGLVVLDLSNTSISSLPSSLGGSSPVSTGFQHH